MIYKNVHMTYQDLKNKFDQEKQKQHVDSLDRYVRRSSRDIKTAHELFKIKEEKNLSEKQFSTLREKYVKDFRKIVKNAVRNQKVWNIKHNRFLRQDIAMFTNLRSNERRIAKQTLSDIKYFQDKHIFDMSHAQPGYNFVESRRWTIEEQEKRFEDFYIIFPGMS